MLFVKYYCCSPACAISCVKAGLEVEVCVVGVVVEFCVLLIVDVSSVFVRFDASNATSDSVVSASSSALRLLLSCKNQPRKLQKEDCGKIWITLRFLCDDFLLYNMVLCFYLFICCFCLVMHSCIILFIVNIRLSCIINIGHFFKNKKKSQLSNKISKIQLWQ